MQRKLISIRLITAICFVQAILTTQEVFKRAKAQSNATLVYVLGFYAN